MLQHRDPYESSYQSNFKGVTPRQSEPWKHLSSPPPMDQNPHKLHSRRSNQSQTPRRSFAGMQNHDQHGNIFANESQIPPIFKPPEIERNRNVHRIMGATSSIQDKAAEIEQNVLTERLKKEDKRVIQFYQTRSSPNCAMVLLIARWLKLSINFVDINLQNPSSVEELKRVNPLGTIPTVVDDGFILYESRTIIKYLVTKFGSKQAIECMYPVDCQRRATIDALIDYEHTSLWPLVSSYVKTFISNQSQSRPHILAQLQNSIVEIVKTLSNTLTVRKYFGSDYVCLADVVIARDLAMLQPCNFFNKQSDVFPNNIMEWMERMMNLQNWYEAMEAYNGFIYSQVNANY